MSLSLMVRVMHEVEVTRPQQAVLLSMAEHANDDGTSCFPSVDRIAWKANYKPRAVEDIMRGLQGEGIINQVAPARGRKPPEYHIDLGKAPSKQPFEEWRQEHGKHRGKDRGAENAPVHSDERGVQSHETGVQSHEKSARENAPEPSVEPQRNHKEEPSVSPRGPEPAETNQNDPPAKQMNGLTIKRCREVGFEPSPGQCNNWGTGWSKYVYVQEGEEPPPLEEQYAVSAEIVAAAAGRLGRTRFWLSVDDAKKRVHGEPRSKVSRNDGQAFALTKEMVENPYYEDGTFIYDEKL